MHMEKNIASSILKTLLNAKGSKFDLIGQCLELQLQKKMPHLNSELARHDKEGNEKYEYAKVPWRWSNEEFDDLIDTIMKIKTSMGYGSSIKRKFTKDRMVVKMKIHDWHNLLQDFLLVAICRPEVRETMYKLGQFFRWMCSKKIKVSKIFEMKKQAIELACHLEMYFPPSVFDI